MAYDEVLAARVEDVVPDATPRKMFGGVGFFVDGNMFAGVSGDLLMVRLGDAAEEARQHDGVGPFDPMGSGKGMRGWITVDQELLAEDDELAAWLDRGRTFTATLPPK